MPLTLAKLFSKTLPVEIEYAGDTVHAEWAPARYTGEMAELADVIVAQDEAAEDEAAVLDVEGAELEAAGEVKAAAAKRRAAELVRQKRERRDQRHLRQVLSELLVSWDILDGDAPLPTDEATLRKLPPSLLTTLFYKISEENTSDPQKAPDSPDSSAPTESSAPNLPGTSSSEAATTSASLPGSSTNGHTPSDITPSGVAGLS